MCLLPACWQAQSMGMPTNLFCQVPVLPWIPPHWREGPRSMELVRKPPAAFYSCPVEAVHIHARLRNGQGRPGQRFLLTTPALPKASGTCTSMILKNVATASPSFISVHYAGLVTQRDTLYPHAYRLPFARYGIKPGPALTWQAPPAAFRCLWGAHKSRPTW